MRAVALSNAEVQKKVAADFVPLKVTIMPGTEKFPLEWPGIEGWAKAYKRMGGEECEGFTCCTVVSPDLEVEYGNTGSAFVWEMFDSIAYDSKKFAAMLDRAKERAAADRKILANKELSTKEQERELRRHRRSIKWAIAKEGRFRLPPKGFSIKGAEKLFEMTGDLKNDE